MPNQFGDLVASELFCPKCQRSQPVRQRLLLVLPSGELFEYLCAQCATSLGERTVTHPAPVGVPGRPARPPASRPSRPAHPGRPRTPRGLLR